MGRKSSINLDDAIKTLALLKQNRERLGKLRKHLHLAWHHIEKLMEFLDEVVETNPGRVAKQRRRAKRRT